jgi:hypothetical protein
MQRSSWRVLTVALASLALAACKNGSNNAADTNGVGAGSAAGQVPPGGVTPGGAMSPAPQDTSAAARARQTTSPNTRDTARDSAAKRSKRP